MADAKDGNLAVIQRKYHYFMERVEVEVQKKNYFTHTLAQLEAKTQIKRTYWAIAIMVMMLLFVLLNAFKLLCDLVVYVLPLYWSFKALESPSTDDDSQWLTYWVCFSAIGLIEIILWPILSFFESQYILIKTAFFVWCMYPSSINGSAVIYVRVIRPLFFKYKKQLDATFSLLERTLDAAAQTANNPEVIKTLQLAANDTKK